MGTSKLLGKPNEILGVTCGGLLFCDGLASHPGNSSISYFFLIAVLHATESSISSSSVDQFGPSAVLPVFFPFGVIFIGVVACVLGYVLGKLKFRCSFC